MSHSSPVFCNTKYRGGGRRTEGLINRGDRKTATATNRGYHTLPLCSCKEFRGSARRARGLEYKQKHKPRSFQPLSVTNIQVYLMNFLLNHNTNKNTKLSPNHRNPITIVLRYNRHPLSKKTIRRLPFSPIYLSRI